MMMNLFSIFDPSTNIMNFSFNWMSTILGLLMLPLYFWMIPNRMMMFWSNILLFLHKEFKTLSGMLSFNGSTIMFISLFTFILFNNSLGLLSYIFTSTSHMTLTLTLAISLWMTYIIYGWINNTQHMLAHMIPQGTPTMLMSFMVIIESISILIRPMTLAIRLMANMIAGHLLITLMSNTGMLIMNSLLMILIFSQIILLILESAVTVIQAYVFSILNTLYSNEVN
uniref:ATP synthase F0 subunit 6 n=1 Tax=Gumaga orientalis TaxID=2566641 RepID=UPI0022DCE1DF|nr:ATP synthase F0 subunit 6 [Gumaga orientalis]UZZ43978.1 ATP synthase F0 subunit 6 [Gumaga orientalis]